MSLPLSSMLDMHPSVFPDSWADDLDLLRRVPAETSRAEDTSFLCAGGSPVYFPLSWGSQLRVRRPIAGCGLCTGPRRSWETAKDSREAIAIEHRRNDSAEYAVDHCDEHNPRIELVERAHFW